MEHPADVMMNTATGPVPCCHEHAKKLAHLMHFMGTSTVETDLGTPMECTNCLNEQKKRTDRG